MRIISSLHDYYDGVANIGGHDNTIIYKREQKIFDDDEKCPFLWQPLKDEFDYIYVVFCGKLYFTLKEGGRYWDGQTYKMEPDIYRWNLEYIEALFKEQQRKKGRFARWLKYDKEKFSNFMSQFDKDYMEMNLEYSAPVLLYYVEMKRHKTKFVVNPCLKDYDFAKAIDPYQAYQKLEQFVDTHFTRKVDMAEVSDKDRYEMKGFDKFSFRKDTWKHKK